MMLMNVLFRQIDRHAYTKLSALDLKWFVESNLTSLLSYPERFYQQLIEMFEGQALLCLKG